MFVFFEIRSIDLVDITNATDIHGTTYDGLTPVAPKGKLVSSVKPAAYASFVSLIDATQLARFGLQNGWLLPSTSSRNAKFADI